MKQKNDTKKMIEMLAENEQALSHLYASYAKMFPRKQKFWLDLAHEEAEHSRMIREVGTGNLPIGDAESNSFDLEILQISLNYIGEKQEQANSEKMSMKEAVSIALGIETGMLERGNFKLLTGDIPDFNQLFESLVRDTQKHSDKIRKELSRKRWLIF